jgi:hypothetical protein
MTKGSDPKVRSLSDLFADKFVWDAFKRAEREGTTSGPHHRTNLLIGASPAASGGASSMRTNFLIRHCVEKLQQWRRRTRRLLPGGRLTHR